MHKDAINEVISSIGTEVVYPSFQMSGIEDSDILRRSNVPKPVLARVRENAALLGFKSSITEDSFIVCTPEGYMRLRSMTSHPLYDEMGDVLYPGTDDEVISVSISESTESSPMVVINQRAQIDGGRFIYTNGDPLKRSIEEVRKFVSMEDDIKYREKIYETFSSFHLAALITHEELHRNSAVIAIKPVAGTEGLIRLAVGTQAYLFAGQQQEIELIVPTVDRITEAVLERGSLVFTGAQVEIELDGNLVGTYGYGLNESVYDYILLNNLDSIVNAYMKYVPVEVKKQIRQVDLYLKALLEGGVGSKEAGNVISERTVSNFLNELGISSSNEAASELTQIPLLLKYIGRGGDVRSLPTSLSPGLMSALLG